MYIRFVVGSDSESIQTQLGLFTEVNKLLLEGKLEAHQETVVVQTFDFFDKELPVPPYRSKGWPTNTFAWFKDSAKEFINRMWEFSAILEENDIQVRILKTEKPGMILYTDAYQVIAQNGNPQLK